ncbi:hypothetical protein [Azospirillum sp. B510]|uniref:hypothetical protein n=1 Tax=Azospirillum sp. (strain B510) TaxID=137722 RepID=UPI0002EDD492|nr:hypothetical protein [Azospirillum sp. B510]
MLFLRDIDADVQLRCRSCGHGGVLPRAMLERRFGPNYPVLSIAPHYRCSRCDSRDIESRPILAVPPADSQIAASDEPSFNAPLAALNGLLASLRGDAPDKAGDGGPVDGRMEDPDPATPPPLSAVVPLPSRGKSPSGLPLSELPLSDLVADGPAEDGAVPLWEPVSLADMAARLGRADPPEADCDEAGDDDDRPEPLPRESAEAVPPDDGDDETLTAMRRLLARAYEVDEDQDDAALDRDDRYGQGAYGREEFGQGEDEPPVFSHRTLVRRDFRDDHAGAEADPWLDGPDPGERDEDFEAGDFKDGEPEDEEPSEEEILSFAIRDPERPAPVNRPAKPVSSPPAAEPLDFDQHRAERRALRPPPPDDEEGFDRTLAALRSMIEDAASEPGNHPTGELDEDKAPPPRGEPRGGGKAADKRAFRTDGFHGNEDDPVAETAGPDLELSGFDAPDLDSPQPAGRRSAQEREIEEAMKALRGLIEEEVQQQAPPPPSQPPFPLSPKPRTGKARPRAAATQDAEPPEARPPAAPQEEGKAAKPAGEPTPLSKTIAALRGMLELDGRRKR